MGVEPAVFQSVSQKRAASSGTELFRGIGGCPPTSNFAEQNRRVCTTLHCLPVLFASLSLLPKRIVPYKKVQSCLEIRKMLPLT